jgi:hypothetical protein
MSEQLEKIAETLREVAAQNAATSQILISMQRQIDGHSATLAGSDGRDGLVGDVRELRTSQEQCPARIAHEHGHQQTGISNTVAVVGLALATLTSLVSIVLQMVLR